MKTTLDVSKIRTAYVASAEHVEVCKAEVSAPLGVFGALVLSADPECEAVWSHNVWKNPEVIKINSINDAIKKLKERNRNWVMYPYKEIRRGTLIEEGLPYVSKKPLKFPTPPPKGKLGSFTLVDKDTILASSECSSAFANGEAVFEEFKVGPPSRAYLKLWEAFTILGVSPTKEQRCLDAGACPGGWSWVLDNYGATVLAIDRSPLDPKVAASPNIQFKKGDALAMGPEDLGAFDWVFSDVICFPERLLEWVQMWINSGATNHILVTIKFRGNEYGVLSDFKKLNPVFLRHLSVNKNEVTFFWKRN
jgi:23S rRNA (cytidine2498-2'-O)-methyltransferase